MAAKTDNVMTDGIKTESDIPPYALANREIWQTWAADYVEAAKRAWSGEPKWGIWGIPDSEVGLLPVDLSGLRCLEIGCGTAYVSAWLARRGGDAVGLDPTPNQLATARELQTRHELHFPLIEGFGERLPFANDSFDFAISEYGAALWSDPYMWIPEAARVIKPGGRLIFLTNSPLAVLCVPPDDGDATITSQLYRPYLGMHEVTWEDSSGEIEFHLPHGVMIELLHANGFRIDRLVELGAPAGATTRYTWANAQWARSWPTEEVWCLTLQPGSS
jgi:SAM-dependent methyltransferase